MISPQGYKLGEDPKNKNPFWNEGEDSSVDRIYATASVDDGTGVPSVSTSKKVSGNDITFGFDFHNLKGETGKGTKGDDGFSPIANVQQTETGATITVTDKSGTTTATVENGRPGLAGQGVPAGGTAGQVLTKKSGTDYDTEWKDPTGGGGTTGGKIRLVDETDSSVFPQYLFKKRYIAEAQYTWNQSFSDVYSAPDTNFNNRILTVTSDIKFTWNTDPSVLWAKILTVRFDADYPEESLVLENDNANKEYGVITSEGTWQTNEGNVTINSVGRMTYYVTESNGTFIKIENFNYTDSEGEHNITAYIQNNMYTNIKYTDTVEKSKTLQVV